MNYISKSQYVLQQGQLSPINLSDRRIDPVESIKESLIHGSPPRDGDSLFVYKTALHASSTGRASCTSSLSSYIPWTLAFLKHGNMINKTSIKAMREFIKQNAVTWDIDIKHKCPTFTNVPTSSFSYRDVIRFFKLKAPELTETAKIQRLARDVTTPAGLIVDLIRDYALAVYHIHPYVRFNLDVYDALVTAGTIHMNRIIRDLPILIEKGLAKDEQLINHIAHIVQKSKGADISMLIGATEVDNLPQILQDAFNKGALAPLELLDTTSITICIEPPFSGRSITKISALLWALRNFGFTLSNVLFGTKNVTEELGKADSFPVHTARLMELNQSQCSVKKRVEIKSANQIYLTSKLNYHKPDEKGSYLEIQVPGSNEPVIKSQVKGQKHISAIGINDRALMLIKKWAAYKNA